MQWINLTVDYQSLNTSDKMLSYDLQTWLDLTASVYRQLKRMLFLYCIVLYRDF